VSGCGPSEARKGEVVTIKLDGGMRGVDHIAYVTWRPEETIHFYREVLGFPLQHCILAPAWGNVEANDFAHFFFDIGGEARLAFFYYFGVPPYDDPNVSALLKRARHLAMLVDTEAELDYYQRRFEDAGIPLRYRVMHELIESIYVWDPNGYSIEISRKLRQLTEADTADTELSIRALIDVSRQPEPSLEKVWRRKAELVVGPTPDGPEHLERAHG
jgi:catechol 2,3-dioxygenase-like lactoylglutathione lyase family enzyme